MVQAWQGSVNENRFGYYPALTPEQEIDVRYYCGNAVFAESKRAR